MQKEPLKEKQELEDYDLSFDENHLYFDPGDSRLITIFTDEKRSPDKSKVGTKIGSVHHIAFDVSSASFSQLIERLEDQKINNSGPKDRGFMDSIYFRWLWQSQTRSFDQNMLWPRI